MAEGGKAGTKEEDGEVRKEEVIVVSVAGLPSPPAVPLRLPSFVGPLRVASSLAGAGRPLRWLAESASLCAVMRRARGSS